MKSYRNSIRDCKSTFSRSQCSFARSSSSTCPFNRILSVSNLKKTQLAGFLKTSAPVSQSFSTIITKPTPPDYDNAQGIIKYIQSFSNPTQPLIKINKIELTQDDLSCLVNRTITKNTIDSILTVIKHLNTKHNKENPNIKKILIAKTNFTQKIFSNEKITTQVDIFSSKYLLFPIFVGH